MSQRLMTAPCPLDSRPPPVHTGLQISEWVQRWSHLVEAGGSVLDVACGTGRHSRWFHDRGCAVTAVDRDAAVLEDLKRIARTVQADLEGQPWPLPGNTYSAVVVTNYLWRPLLSDIARSVATSGVLIYETFAEGNASVGKPSNPDFLLQPGELLHFAQQHDLRVVAYEDGFCSQPDRFIQRLVAIRPSTGNTNMPRSQLQPVSPPRAS